MLKTGVIVSGGLLLFTKQMWFMILGGGVNYSQLFGPQVSKHWLNVFISDVLLGLPGCSNPIRFP